MAAETPPPPAPAEEKSEAPPPSIPQPIDVDEAPAAAASTLIPATITPSINPNPSPQPIQPITPSLPTSAPQLPLQRGVVALGVPAPPLPSAFNSPPFGMPRSVPDTMPTLPTSQVRQPVQGIGITGSTLRPTMLPGNPLQQSVGPPNMQPLTTQTFQGHNMFRGQALGPSGSSAANTGQNQPWLSKGQVKSPLPPQSIRPQLNPQSVQQRAHIPQQKQAISTTMQQQHAPSQAKQVSDTSQPLEQLPQQYPPPRAQLPVPPQQQIGKNQGLGIQRSSSLGVMQAGVNHSGPPSRTSIEESEDNCNRILSKRTIQELVNQIDSSEKLEPEVEDILVDIAEEFVESITTFGCSLAKHRKSTVLEAKDILLHVERNWNMTLPGFGGDEIKIYKKPLTNDLHKERLAVIKKSIVASESTNAKSSAGQAASNNPKSHSAKGPANMLGSPNT